jgi:hypothetical protein
MFLLQKLSTKRQVTLLRKSYVLPELKKKLMPSQSHRGVFGSCFSVALEFFFLLGFTLLVWE